MKTGTFVTATAAAGVIGGIVGAWLFLTFFADSLRPKAEAPAPAAAVESPFSPEEETALRRLPGRVEELTAALDALRRERTAAPRPQGPTPPAGPAAERLEAPSLATNERAAIATLRNMASCQAQIQTSGKIDCDNDGIGEYGTFLEMTGTVGVRKGTDGGSPLGSDFSTQGRPVNPPIMAPSMANVDGEGRVEKNGYYYRILLPDTQGTAAFVHETSGPGLSGGTGRIGVDMSETTWCCYAWPVEAGKTGNRVFFINQSGDVLQSSNERARHGGAASPDPRSAFRGAGITSMVAVGTAGNDGDVWKVTN